jgi:Ca2+-binding EF-hand superfamily protein
VCPGDCDHNGVVTIDELIRAVDIALGEQPLPSCASLDRNGDGQIGINELIAAVDVALRGCIFNGQSRSR